MTLHLQNTGATAAALQAASAILPLGYQVETLGGAGRRHFVRAQSGCEHVSGYRSCLIGETGLFVSATHMHSSSARIENLSGTGIMKFHVRLSGASRIGCGKDEGSIVPEMSCGALIHPAGETKFERYDGFVDEVSVTVGCTPGFLVEEFGLEPGHLPQQMIAFMHQKEAPLTELRAPMTIETRKAAELIVDEFSNPAARALMIEARALELLAHFIEQFEKLENGQGATPILAHDRRIAEAARSVLETDFIKPPGLRALSNRVGTHPAKLMRLFKAVHGATISDFVQARRMEEAMRMLREGSLPITQIAFEVGYEHSSNFATAFKRYFGAPPSAVRTGLPS